MACPKCGAPTNPGATFCPSCGASLNAPAQQPMPQPSPAPYSPPAKAKKSNKKLIIAGVIVLVVVLIIAAVAAGGGSNKATNNGSNDTNNSNTDNDNGANTDTSNGNTNARDQIADVTYSGTGDKVTDKFTLQAGVTIFYMKHSGSSNFAVKLYNDTGEYVELLANEIGIYDGATMIGVKSDNIVGAQPGKHYLDIDADGAWNITIGQPRVASGSALPQTMSGSGPSVSIPLQLAAGTVIFNMTHDGSSNFAVILWSDDGEYEDLIANEIGAYSGETSVTVGTGLLQVSPGIAWLNIAADGNWTIKVTYLS